MPTRQATSTLRVGPIKVKGEGYGLFVLAVIMLPLSLALWIGMVMLTFGVVHSYYEPVPAFGFWHTAGILLLVQLLTYKSSNEK